MVAPQTPTNVTTRTTLALVPLTTPITVIHVRPTTSTLQRLYHLKILFLSSGSVLAADRVRPNENSVNIKTLSLGGYTSILRQSFRSIMDFNFSFFDENNQLFDYNFPLNTIIPNQFGAFKILQNSMLIMAQNESSTIWNLVPKILSFNNHGQEGSNNLTINYTEIDIIFYEPVSLEDVKLSIYQIFSQGDTLGQVFNSKNCNLQCTVRGNIVIINKWNAQYSIQMSNNFVKGSAYNESYLGINSYAWTFQTGSFMIQDFTVFTELFKFFIDSESHLINID
ncbi:34222_t:CDS:2 [Gigaspora margarita]|uniref:34222_t:CDS:1 n=1 Tax=Gigaspora margarita TaxID=4874 RepID=A0ABM8W4P8_GIGMA|nr:34222_t:CDS:2 [Gigaspora margarita]